MYTIAIYGRQGRGVAEEWEFEQTLGQRLETLESLLGRLVAADAADEPSGSLAADLAAARALCKVVETLIDGVRP